MLIIYMVLQQRWNGYGAYANTSWQTQDQGWHQISLRYWFFLKVNHDYWDARSVQLAYTKALNSQSDKVQEMIDEDDAYDANLSDDE